MNYKSIIFIIIFQFYQGPFIVGFNHALQEDEVSGINLFDDAKLKVGLSEYKEAKALYLKALPLLLNEKKIQEYCDGMIDLSVIYFWEDKIDSSFIFIEKAKNILEVEVGITSPLYGVCLSNLSSFYYFKRQVSKSIEIENQALNILENTNYDKKAIAQVLLNIALSQDVLGDYNGAIENLKRALSYLPKDKQYDNLLTCEAYYFLGLMYLYKKEFEKAIKSLNLSREILYTLAQSAKAKQLHIQSLQRLAYCYNQVNQTSKANMLISQALKTQQGDFSHRKYLSVEIQADIAIHLKKYLESVSKAKEAIRLSKIAQKDFQKHPVIARQYTHLGEIYQTSNQLDSAVHYFHQGVLYLANGFDDPKIHSNPEVQQCFLEYDIIRSLRGKARALYLRYQESKDLRDLKASLDTYELTHDFIKKLKEDITTMGSKQRLAGDALEIYEEAIETAVTLHRETGEEEYLEKALFFAESNKAILLLESMNERMAQSVSGIPDSLLEKEKQFRVDVAYYEREINEENNKKGKEPDQDKIKEWEDKLYTLRREYQQLIDQFEAQYPKYYQLKFDTKLATLSDIRKGMIDRKTAFLEYFVGTKNVYLFEITKSNFKVHQFSKPDGFEEDIKEIHRMVKKPRLSTEEIPSFQAKIYQIYAQYLASSLDELPSKINRLLIVPDDLLNLIPFELLSKNQDQPQYLIQDYTIGYAYSASLFQASRKQEGVVADQLFLGYAPAFSAPMAENRNCAGDRLANLENSEREVVGIQELLGGEVRIGMEANRDSFLAQAKHYRIIHLATHACMDEENPMQSKVFFADDPIVNQDLFNLNLSADLAVLSACNTGSGQLVKGDGVLSLSKGFVHAGCPSAVMSLWSVDDFSTSEIMIDFYDYLKKGYTKDKALRQAKLDFIASADKVKRHPFFWAAFVQMGDPVALDLGQAKRPWKLILGSLILVLIAGMWLRNGGKKKRLTAA